jgi:archaellum biogenesis ATPase FlaH
LGYFDYSFITGNSFLRNRLSSQEIKEGLTYKQTIQKLEKIFEIEDEALQLWELDRLANCVKRSASRLMQIWDTYQNDFTPFQPIELHDFLKREELERSWLVAGYIPVGTVIGLIAGGGSGKTLLTYDLIKAIATGTNWNGFRATQTKVLIVQTDEQFLDTKERLEIANYEEAISAGTVFLLEKWQFTQFRRLAKFIKEHNIGFCAIDSFTSTNRRSNGEEKDSSYASCIYDLRDLASETKCTFLILHHTNRAGGSRGTTAFEDNVSETWFLKVPEPSANLSPEHRILQIKKSRSSCNGTFKILLDVNDYSWKHEGDHAVVGQFDDNSQPPLSARIMEYLEENRGQHFSPDELIYVRSLSDCKTRDAMRKQLERLRKKGLIDAEDVVKDAGGVSGKHRYKVYFASCVNSLCPRGTEPAPSMDSTLVDKPICSSNYVHEAELPLGIHPTLVDNHYLYTEDNQ